MQPERPFNTLYPLENEEEAAAKLGPYLRQHLHPEWKDNVYVFDTPLSILICSEAAESRLLPRALAMEIGKANWYHPIEYATPENNIDIEPNISALRKVIRRYSTTTRPTIIIRDLKAYYDYFNASEICKEYGYIFNDHLSKINSLNNLIAGICTADLYLVRNLVHYPAPWGRNVWIDAFQAWPGFNDKILVRERKHNIYEIKINKRELIMSPLLEQLNNNFLGIKLENTLIFSTDNAKHEILAALELIQDEEELKATIAKIKFKYCSNFPSLRYHTYIDFEEFDKDVKQKKTK